MEGLAELGYIGLFIGAFLAATIIPFSSDILLLAVLAAGGDVWTTVVVATAGNWLGGMTSYGLGRLGKWEWIEKWLKVDRDKLERQKCRIKRYGSVIAFFAWLPFIGDLLAVGLGFYRLPFVPTTLFMLAGKACRFIAWGLIYTHFIA